MKKLKLKLDGMKEMLTKEQMKKISGGSDADCAWGGTCNFISPYDGAMRFGDCVDGAPWYQSGCVCKAPVDQPNYYAFEIYLDCHREG